MVGRSGAIRLARSLAATGDVGKYVAALSRRLAIAGRARLWTAVTRARFRFLGVRPGGGLKVTGRLHLFLAPGARVWIGRDVVIRSGHGDNPVGAYVPTIIYVGPQGVLTIEDGAGISNSVLICYDSIRIGRGSYIGGGCKLYDTDFHPLEVEARLAASKAPRTAPVDVGDGAFVGGHSLVLKGTRIGAEAVVGAGSVVAGVIPPKEVWGGNPVRCLRAAEGTSRG